MPRINKTSLTIKEFESLDTKDYELVTDSQNVEETLKHIGKTRTAKKHGIEGLFVLVGDGDYESVYGFIGTVPYLTKTLVRLL